MLSSLSEPLLDLSSYALSSVAWRQRMAALFNSKLHALVLFPQRVSLSCSSLGTVSSGPRTHLLLQVMVSWVEYAENVKLVAH